jgi:hypothetical protein
MKVKLSYIALSILLAFAGYIISIPVIWFPILPPYISIPIPNLLYIFSPLAPLLYILAVILFIAAFQREKAKP